MEGNVQTKKKRALAWVNSDFIASEPWLGGGQTLTPASGLHLCSSLVSCFASSCPVFRPLPSFFTVFSPLFFFLFTELGLGHGGGEGMDRDLNAKTNKDTDTDRHTPSGRRKMVNTKGRREGGGSFNNIFHRGALHR